MTTRLSIVRAALAIAAALTFTAQGCATAATPTILDQALPRLIAIGWNLTTPELVRAAADNGITVAILYGEAPRPDSPLGAALSARGIRLISAEISQRLAEYRVHPHLHRRHAPNKRPSLLRSEPKLLS